MRYFVHDYSGRPGKAFGPSFYTAGFINERHSDAINQVASVQGRLEDPDHYKLYEASYFAQGPVLEIGRFAGKSTSLLALAAKDSGAQWPIYSIDKAAAKVADAQANIERLGLSDRVTLIQGDSADQVRRLPGTFDVVFVDGDHSYAGVRRDIFALANRVRRGGIVMFHDYLHPHNDGDRIGVRRAVDELVDDVRLEFRGQFGGIRLFEQL